MRRRDFLVAGGGALVLAGCGGSASSGERAGGQTVRLTHKYGTTTIEGTPKRVAVVGLREQDDLLALGIVPVLVTRFAGDDTGIREWARDELRGRPEPPSIETTDGIPVERVAAARPDLIVARFSGMTKDEYEQLSRLAPVVAQPKGVPDYGEPWQDEMRAVGEAVGRRAQAQRLVEAAEAKLARVRREHPSWEGKTALVGAPYQGVFVYGSSDVRSRLLSELGFAFPEGIDDALGDVFGGQLSEERLDLIDVDALVWLADAAGRRQLERNRAYTTLDVSDRAIFIPPTDPLYNSTSALTVLNVDEIVTGLVPKLGRAVGT